MTSMPSVPGLPNGLELDVLPEVHLTAVLHLQAHVGAPAEEFGHHAVLPRLGRRAPGDGEDVKIPKGEVLGDGVPQDAVDNALVVDISPKFLQGDAVPAICRREQAGVGGEPVLREEKLRLRLHRAQVSLQRLFAPGPGGPLQGPHKIFNQLAVVRVLLLGLRSRIFQL